MNGPTSPRVAIPPRQLPRSTTSVFAPFRAAEIAAQTPAGPPPTTRTSVSIHGRAPPDVATPPSASQLAATPANGAADANFKKSLLFIRMQLYQNLAAKAETDSSLEIEEVELAGHGQWRLRALCGSPDKARTGRAQGGRQDVEPLVRTAVPRTEDLQRLVENHR